MDWISRSWGGARVKSLQQLHHLPHRCLDAWRRGDKLRRRTQQQSRRARKIRTSTKRRRPIRINVKRLEKVSNNQRGFRFLVEPHLLLRQLQLLGIPKRVYWSIVVWFWADVRKGKPHTERYLATTRAAKLRNLKRFAGGGAQRDSRPIVPRKQTRNSICAVQRPSFVRNLVEQVAGVVRGSAAAPPPWLWAMVE